MEPCISSNSVKKIVKCCTCKNAKSPPCNNIACFRNTYDINDDIKMIKTISQLLMHHNKV